MLPKIIKDKIIFDNFLDILDFICILQQDFKPIFPRFFVGGDAEATFGWLLPFRSKHYVRSFDDPDQLFLLHRPKTNPQRIIILLRLGDNIVLEFIGSFVDSALAPASENHIVE